MAKKQNIIKIKNNANCIIDLYNTIKTPINKIKNILILGNTMGLFGYYIKTDDFITDDFTNTADVRYFNNREWLKTLLDNGANVNIVCFDNGTKQYYSMLEDKLITYFNNTTGTFNITYTQYFNDNSKTSKKEKTNWIHTHIINMGMKFDVCIMNAPYKNGLHEKFEEAGIDMVSDEIVFVSPLSWVTGKRKNKDLCNRIDKYHTEINTVEPAQYFDAHIGTTFGITYVNKKTNSQLYYNDVCHASAYDIKPHSDDIVIKDLYDLFRFDDNVHGHIFKNSENAKGYSQASISVPNSNDFIFAVSVLSGQSHARSKQTGEFYNIVSKTLQYEKRCGKYIDVKNKAAKPNQIYYIPFNTETELKNFWKFIHTDFVALILYMHKTTKTLDKGELSYIPWLDFTQEWNDLKLFSYFGITKSQLEHIYSVLPNYFNNNRQYVLDNYETK